MFHPARRLALPAAALLCAALAACKGKPEDVIPGDWSVQFAATRIFENRLKMKVHIDADGTFIITGGPDFYAMAGVKQVRGEYEIGGGGTSVSASYERDPVEEAPTDFALKIVNRNQLVLTPSDGDEPFTLNRIKE